MAATIRQIRDDALLIIGDVNGPGVQQFAEDRMRRDVIRSFNLLFKKATWRQYSKWTTITLDGTTGLATASWAEQIKDLEDILLVNRASKDVSLSRLPQNRNPNVFTGTTGQFWDGLPVTNAAYLTKRIKVYPITSTGNLDVYHKVYPLVPPALDFDWEDTFDLDRDMLAWGTAFFSLASSDTNPNAATVCRNMMEMKYNDIMSQLSSHMIPIEGRGGVPSSWREG